MPLELKEKQKLTDELTLILLRGNGAPKTLRLQVPELRAFVLGLSSLVVILAVAAAALSGAYLYEKKMQRKNSAAYPATQPSQQISTPMAPTGTNDSSESAGLREDIARLNAELENRKKLPQEINENIALQMMGARSALLPESEAFIKIRNADVKRDNASKETTVSFELHNVEPTQKQIRGYIVVLAKSSNSLHSYPVGAFSPKENILLNFTKGETFAVSRFRQAQASFKDLPTNINNFQVILFNTLGRVLASLQVDGK